MGFIKHFAEMDDGDLCLGLELRRDHDPIVWDEAKQFFCCEKCGQVYAVDMGECIPMDTGKSK